MTKLEGPRPEMPFLGMQIYVSASMKGVINHDPELAKKIVTLMQACGAKVLSEHVVAGDEAERKTLFSKNTGVPVEALKDPAVWRKQDMEWVDAATHIVSIVDGASHGVGMEIERALLKPQRGLPLTPILALVQEKNLAGLSLMITGIREPQFRLVTYRNAADAKRKLRRFLSATR